MTKKSFLQKAMAAPHVMWAVLFIIAPLLFVAYYAFTDSEGNFTFSNIFELAQASYMEIFLRSLRTECRVASLSVVPMRVIKCG